MFQRPIQLVYFQDFFFPLFLFLLWCLDQGGEELRELRSADRLIPLVCQAVLLTLPRDL